MTDEKRERLTLLIEECSEIQQNIAKIFRFGEASYNPKDPEKEANVDKLERELGDFLLILYMMNKSNDIKYKNIIEHSKNKVEKLNKFMKHNKLENPYVK